MYGHGLDRQSRPFFLSKEVPLHATTATRPPCVPVFTTENPCPEQETRLASGHASQKTLIAVAITILTEFGWTFGCDGELLPPAWFRRAS